MAARASRTRRTTSAPPPSRDNDDEMENNGEPASETEAMLDEADERMKGRVPTCQIMRFGDDGRLSHLDSVASSIVNEDWLAETYGGGKFKVTKRGLTPDGRWGYVGSEVVEIDESIPFKGSMKAQKLRREAASGAVHNADGSRAGGNGSMAEVALLSFVKSQQEAEAANRSFLLNVIQEGRNAQQVNQTMMLEMLRARPNGGGALEALMPLLTATVPVLLSSLTNKKEQSLTEIAALLDSLKPKDEGAKLSDALDMVRKLREAASDVTDGAEPSPPWMKVAEKLAEFLPALVQARQQPSSPESATGAPSATATVSPPAITAGMGGGVPLPENITADDVWGLIESQIGYIRTFAAMNRDPRRVAAMAVEFASPPQQALMREVLGDETFLDQFFARFPAMQAHRVWTADFVNELHGELFGFDDADDSDDGDPGSSDQEEGNAKNV